MLLRFDTGCRSRRDWVRVRARLHLVRVVAEREVLAGAADVLGLDQQRREQLALDAEMPLLGIRGFVRVAVADYPRVRGVQRRSRFRFDRHDGRKRVVDRAHQAEVERVGLMLNVLRDREWHVQVIQVAGRVRTGEVCDAEAGPEHGPHVVGEPVGHAQARREVVVARLLVGTSGRAVLSGEDERVGLEVEVAHPVLLFRRRVEDLVAKPGIDGQPAVDLEVVLHERRVLDDAERWDFEKESAGRAVEVAKEHLGQPGAAGVGHRVVDEAGAKGDEAPRVVVDHRRGRAIDEPVSELHLVAPLDPDQGIFDLVVPLARVDRKKRGPSRDAREVGDVDVRQAGRDLVDVDALDAERRRGVDAVVGLRREGIGPGIADAQLVHEGGCQHFRVVERGAMRRQARVLDAGDEGAEIEARRGVGGRRQAAVGLALRRVEAELPVVEPHEDRVVVREAVIDAARVGVVGDLAVGRRDVVVEIAGSVVRQRVDAGDVAADGVNAVGRDDVVEERGRGETAGSSRSPARTS